MVTRQTGAGLPMVRRGRRLPRSGLLARSPDLTYAAVDAGRAAPASPPGPHWRFPLLFRRIQFLVPFA